MADGPLTVLDTHHMLTTPPPKIDWEVDGVFAKGKFTLFGGREKGGKSLIQLAFARQMAIGGGSVAGVMTYPGRTLILDAENGYEETHRRVHSLTVPASVADRLVFAEAHGFNLLKHLDALARLMAQYEPDLVLLDSFRSLWTGDERDEAEVAAALDPLRTLAHQSGVAIGLTHHATKGEGDYRGSTAIGAAADWICLLSRDREDPDAKRRRRLTTPYARFAPERDDRWLLICSEGDEGPVWLETAEPFVAEHEAPARDAVEVSLERVLSVATLPDPYRALATWQPPPWTGADLARMIGRGKNDGTVRRALERLEERGLVARGGDKRWQPLGDFFHRNGHEEET